LSTLMESHYNTIMNKKIVYYNSNNEKCGEWFGEWKKGFYDSVIGGEVMIDFEEWGGDKEDEGNGWKMLSCDGEGMLIVDEDKDVDKCYEDYWHKVLKRGY